MAKNKRDIPNYQLPIIETHFHLDYLKEGSVEEILEKARNIGIERFLTIAVSPDNLNNVISLTQQHADVYGTLGIHPHDAELYNADVEAIIRQNLAPENRSHKLRAVGEIGLDYFGELRPIDEKQRGDSQLYIRHRVSTLLCKPRL